MSHTATLTGAITHFGSQGALRKEAVSESRQKVNGKLLNLLFNFELFYQFDKIIFQKM